MRKRISKSIYFPRGPGRHAASEERRPNLDERKSRQSGPVRSRRRGPSHLKSSPGERRTADRAPHRAAHTTRFPARRASRVRVRLYTSRYRLPRARFLLLLPLPLCPFPPPPLLPRAPPGRVGEPIGDLERPLLQSSCEWSLSSKLLLRRRLRRVSSLRERDTSLSAVSRSRRLERERERADDNDSRLAERLQCLR